MHSQYLLDLAHAGLHVNNRKCFLNYVFQRVVKSSIPHFVYKALTADGTGPTSLGDSLAKGCCVP
jgi:hypothetical protein